MSIKNIILALGLASTSSAVRLQSQGFFDDIGGAISGAVDDASNWTKGAVHDAKKWTDGAAHDTAHWTKGAVNDTGKFLNKEKDTFVSAVTGAVTSEGLSKLGTEAKEVAEEAAEEGLASAAETPIPPV